MILINSYKKLIVLSFLVLFFLIFQISAKVKKFEKNSNYLATGVLTDDSITVKNFNFVKRFGEAGKGNYLDFSFTIKNNTDFPIKMKMFAMGFYEKNEAEPKYSKKYKYRKYIKYPKWRKRDFEKEKRNIVYLDSIPKVDRKVVYSWLKTNKPETFENQYGRVYNYTDKKWEYKKLGRYDYPFLLDFINYVDVNIKDKLGLNIDLWGMENNKFNATTDDKKTEKNEGFGDHVKAERTHLIIKDTLETTFIGRFYSRTRKRNRFFNNFGIILYAVSSKDYEKKDIAIKKIVFRKFFKFDKRLKVK